MTKPCRKCGLTERAESDNRCLPCQRAYNAALYLRDKAKVNARSKQWDVDNSERREQIRRDWLAENGERAKNYAMLYRCQYRDACRNAKNKWQKENYDLAQASHVRRKSAKINATPSWANEFFVSEAYHIAKVRSKVTGIKWHVDHIVPLRSKLVCGLHVEHNLQVITASENLAKSNVIWPDKF